MLFGVQRCVESRCLTRIDQTRVIRSIAVKIVSHVNTAYVIIMFELGMDSPARNRRKVGEKLA